ncbi:MAG: FAD-dependent oxidoreductase [Verrucomicrobiota bacterium]
MKTDFLIIGQGLAGSLLSWELIRRGRRVLVVDRDESETASKVAAGLITPLAGNRFNLPDLLPARLKEAQRCYWEIEEETGSRLFHHRRILRLFQNSAERETWEQRLASNPDEYDPFHEPLAVDPSIANAPWGGFEMKGGGWLDVPAFLDVTQQMLLERASYAIGRVRPEQVRRSNGEILWKNVRARGAIFCQGWQGEGNRFFDWVKFNSAAGDILTGELEPLPPRSDREAEADSRVLNSGGWLIPLGGDRVRAGSTYRHEFDESDLLSGSGGDEGRNEVLAKIERLTPRRFSLETHRAAIRPIIHRSRPFLGQHPTEPGIYFFNGLGSKGVLNGPSHARELADLILDGKPVRAEADVCSLKV